MADNQAAPAPKSSLKSSKPDIASFAGLLIALGGIVWGFTRHEEGFKRVAQAIIAIGLVLGATNLVTTLGFQGCVF